MSERLTDHDALVSVFRAIDMHMECIALLMLPFVDDGFDPDRRFTPLEHVVRLIAEEHGIDWKEVRGR